MTQEEIIELREKLGLSQMAFAIRLGVSVDAVRAWEQGRKGKGPGATSVARMRECEHQMRPELLQRATEGIAS